MLYTKTSVESIKQILQSKKKKKKVSIRRPASVYKEKYKQQCARLNFGLTHHLRHMVIIYMATSKNTHLKSISQNMHNKKNRQELKNISVIKHFPLSSLVLMFLNSSKKTHIIIKISLHSHLRKNRMMRYIHGNINIHSTLSDTRMLRGFALWSGCICDDHTATSVCWLENNSLSCFIWLW